ncbi:HGGxSTG domain-containing protein [Roseibium aggregatum]|uniref:HGGxSTG domain-containing protein n=1 Tax=Roseibium aggregatum TaxID=187304 RepID=UPI001A8C2547|nr:HGGxSTG domain-containing protein [Roseibium aggregatum]MBN8182013.1 hypothetical protein [Roseibium aggregatum]
MPDMDFFDGGLFDPNRKRTFATDRWYAKEMSLKAIAALFAPDAPKCGAKTRAGTPCKRRPYMDSPRCHLHGALSGKPDKDGNLDPRLSARREAYRKSRRKKAARDGRDDPTFRNAGIRSRLQDQYQTRLRLETHGPYFINYVDRDVIRQWQREGFTDAVELERLSEVLLTAVLPRPGVARMKARLEEDRAYIEQAARQRGEGLDTYAPHALAPGYRPEDLPRNFEPQQNSRLDRHRRSSA